MISETPNAVMLFAAGFGTRMKELTKTCPKPMIHVAGHPLIDHSIDLAKSVGLTHLVANTHYLPDVLERHLTPQGIAISREDPDILDTGGGLRKALPLLGRNPVFTSNTDAIWKGPNPFSVALSAWNPQKMDALLVCVPLSHCIGRQGGGDFSVSVNGQISRGGDMVYGGIQILKTESLDQIEEDSFSLNVIWNRMAKDDRLFAARYPGYWCDVGHPGGIALAEELIARDDI